MISHYYSGNNGLQDFEEIKQRVIIVLILLYFNHKKHYMMNLKIAVLSDQLLLTVFVEQLLSH